MWLYSLCRFQKINTKSTFKLKALELEVTYSDSYSLSCKKTKAVLLFVFEAVSIGTKDDGNFSALYHLSNLQVCRTHWFGHYWSKRLQSHMCELHMPKTADLRRNPIKPKQAGTILCGLQLHPWFTRTARLLLTQVQDKSSVAKAAFTDSYDVESLSLPCTTKSF